MKVKIFAPLVAAAFVLAACDGNVGTKEGVGTVAGAVGGGLLGSTIGGGSGQLAAVAAGTLLGAFLGNEIGKSLDRADQAAMQRAETQAQTAPIGQTIEWQNPDSGNSGTVTPTREGTDAGGRYCREYQTSVTVEGQSQEAFGTACQTETGQWEIVS